MWKLFTILGWKIIIFFVFIVAFGIASSYCTVLIADYTQKLMSLLNNVIPNGSNDHLINEGWINGGIMIGLSLACSCADICCCIFGAWLATKVAYKIRDRVFNKVNAMSFMDVDKFSISSLITRSTNDVTQVQTLFGQFQLVITGISTIIFAIIKINSIWQLSVTVTCIVVLLILVVIIIALLVIPKFKLMQKITDGLNESAREQLTGLRVIRAFNAEDYENKKFEKINHESYRVGSFVRKTNGIVMPIISLFIQLTVLIIYFVAAFLIRNGMMIPTKFLSVPAFSTLAIQMLFGILKSVMFLISLPRALISSKRINEVIDYQVSISDPINPIQMSNKNDGEIEFKNVYFKYSKTAKSYCLENISFSAKKGEFIAIIGSTGSGKSSLVKLIPRFYDATEGEILINGVNIKNVKQNDLHNKIGYVPQKSLLFAGNIKNNIALGSKNAIVDEHIECATDIACASDFINKTNDKLNSLVSQNGSNFSGGQKQRISIARALYRKPPIIVFDDSFSALDYRTDKVVRSNIAKKMKGTTCVVVAQRVGTIMNADKIIVLDNGRVVGIGKHNELLKKCKQYQEIALSQLSKKELGYGK